MVQSLIHERESTHQYAINEVSEKWAKSQTISGPYVSIPYYKYVKQFSEQTKEYKVVKIKDYLYYMPETLNITGDVKNEKRKRGIYEIVVYDSELDING